MKRFVAMIALASSGCSWMMVAGPPAASVSSAPPGMTSAEEPLDCTREKFAPVVDSVFASIFGVGTLAAIPGTYFVVTEEDDYNQMFGVMLIGAAAIYAGLAAPFYFSARSGYRKVEACRRAHEQRGHMFSAR